MLYELKALIGSPVIATDGETGRIRTFLFDDQSWKVSCLVGASPNRFQWNKSSDTARAIRGPWDENAA